LKTKSEKNAAETENFSLRQELQSKSREIIENFDLYKTQKTEYDSYSKQVNFLSKPLISI